MVELKQSVVAALAVALTFGTAPVHAFPVIDVANLFQNAAAAYQSVKQLSLLYAQTQTQIQQLRMMQQQLKTMDASQIAGIAGDITGVEELHKLERALAANRDLMGSIERVKEGFDQRLDTAKLMKLTWKEYVNWEQGRLARREEGALARVQAEVHAMKRIESDYAFAREQAGKIAGTSGTHEAMQQMNLQMNRVVQQNAELMRQLSTAFGRATAEREMQEAEEQARTRAQESAYRAGAESARLADRDAIEKWSGHRR